MYVSVAFLFSRDYFAATTVALVEYFVELWLFPEFKNSHYGIFLLGLALVLFGDFLRKLGMITAKQAFTHLIQYEKRSEHQLVTHGIYRFVRHPGYLGWFIWAPSTQIMLRNPISFVVFICAAWYFFNDRIPHEEQQLVKMFGQRYSDYRRKTPTYIPFIK